MERRGSFTKDGQHLPLVTLMHELNVKNVYNRYLKKNWIPTYPRPELLVSHVSHSTELRALRGIKADGGFRNPKPRRNKAGLVWFSLTPSPEELCHAHTRDMVLVPPGEPERVFRPDRRPQPGPQDRPEEETPQQRPREFSPRRPLAAVENLSREGGTQGGRPDRKRTWAGAEEDQAEEIGVTKRRALEGPRAEEGAPEGPRAEEEAVEGGEALSEGDFLQKFASSPAFMSSSRYGSFRFSFSLRDVLGKYSQQFCDGAEPVLRVYHTVLYKQEVMYAVLVHSPEHNSKFSEFPLLEETPHCICAFRAEPEPHFLWRPQAMSETHRFELVEDGQKLHVEKAPCSEFYAWDHVTLALHVDDKVLGFEDHELGENLRFCKKDKPPVSHQRSFETSQEAEAEVKKLWPHHRLQKFDESHLHITD